MPPRDDPPFDRSTTLILGIDDLRQIRDLRDRALRSRIPYAAVAQMAKGSKLDPEKYPVYFGTIDGFFVLYTIEQHPRGWLRHLVLQRKPDGRDPVPELALGLATAFDPGVIPEEVGLFPDDSGIPTRQSLHAYYPVDDPTEDPSAN